MQSTYQSEHCTTPIRWWKQVSAGRWFPQNYESIACIFKSFVVVGNFGRSKCRVRSSQEKRRVKGSREKEGRRKKTPPQLLLREREMLSPGWPDMSPDRCCPLPFSTPYFASFFRRQCSWKEGVVEVCPIVLVLEPDCLVHVLAQLLAKLCDPKQFIQPVIEISQQKIIYYSDWPNNLYWESVNLICVCQCPVDPGGVIVMSEIPFCAFSRLCSYVCTCVAFSEQMWLCWRKCRCVGGL